MATGPNPTTTTRPPPSCEDTDLTTACVMEYFAEAWTTGPRPKRLWRVRFELPDETFGRPLYPKEASAVAMTHDGKTALFGFRDGDVVARDILTGSTSPRRGGFVGIRGAVSRRAAITRDFACDCRHRSLQALRDAVKRLLAAETARDLLAVL